MSLCARSRLTALTRPALTDTEGWLASIVARQTTQIVFQMRASVASDAGKAAPEAGEGTRGKQP